MKCRHCKRPLKYNFLDLGCAPPSNSYLNNSDLNKAEVYYPLKIKVCNKCWLVQTVDYFKPKSFFNSQYAYFSSSSSSWLLHSKKYAKKIIKDLNLNQKSMVIEVASNDGYLLKNFIKKKIPCLGIEPTKSTADAAKKFNIPVIRKFFGETLAKQLIKKNKQADLIIGNNVYAHVPDINDFTQGLKTALKARGIITLEFPHLMNLIKQTQFDTIYHEHFSYLSFYTVNRIFSSAGLRVWNVEKIPTHGGSLRVYGCHKNDKRKNNPSVKRLLNEESNENLRKLDTYINFKDQVNKIKDDLLLFLIKQKKAGKKVVAYGAAAKGNTLLNYAGVKKDLLDFVVDKSKFKIGKYLPASHIPIYKEEKILKAKPDYILILPWNIKDEIKEQLSYIKEWNGQFLVSIPKLKVVN